MKDSGVDWIGKIPEDWKTIKLKFACDVNPPKSELNNISNKSRVSFLPMERIGGNGHLDLKEKRDLSEVKNSFTYFRDNDVIVAKITPCFENGKGALCKNLENGIGFGTTELHVLRPYQKFNSFLIFYWTRSHPFMISGESLMHGAAGQKRVPTDFIKNFRISYSNSIKEQEKIGEFLKIQIEKLDNKIQNCQKLISLLKEKSQSLLNEAVTKGLDTTVSMKESKIELIGKIPAHWGKSQFHRILKKPISYGVVVPDDDPTGVPMIRSGALESSHGIEKNLIYISRELEEKYKRTRIEGGEIIIALVGATIGQCTVLSKKYRGYNVSRAVGVITPKKEHNPFFLKFLLKSNIFKNLLNMQSIGAAQPVINLESISNFIIPLPPKEEQNEIVEFLDKNIPKINSLISKLNSQIKKFQEFQQCIISSAVSGKIDVRDFVE